MLDLVKMMCMKHSRSLVASHYGYVCEACEGQGFQDDVITSGGLQR